MVRSFLATLIISITFFGSTLFSSAQSLDDAVSLPVRLLFTVSGGSWADEVEIDGSVKERRGYYRLSAFRRVDNTSAVFLQKIFNTPQGPEEVLTLELEEISSMNAFITDMRPESSTGGGSGPGFAAYIYLKTDPTVLEPETYSVYVDDLDDIYVEQASN